MTTPKQRVGVRATVAGAIALFSSLAASTVGSDLQLGEVFLGLASGFSGAGVYIGIGAASSNVEPSIGAKP